MRLTTTLTLSALLLTGAPLMTGCQTSQPGVKSTYRSQWTTINANTVKTTAVAKDVLQDMKLRNIESKSTAVDGNVQGFTADDTKITVDVKKVTDNTSQVSVYVGAMGDPDMGKDILAQIQHKTGS